MIPSASACKRGWPLLLLHHLRYWLHTLQYDKPMSRDVHIIFVIRIPPLGVEIGGGWALGQSYISIRDMLYIKLKHITMRFQYNKYFCPVTPWGGDMAPGGDGGRANIIWPLLVLHHYRYWLHTLGYDKPMSKDVHNTFRISISPPGVVSKSHFHWIGCNMLYIKLKQITRRVQCNKKIGTVTPGDRDMAPWVGWGRANGISPILLLHP